MKVSPGTARYAAFMHLDRRALDLRTSSRRLCRRVPVALVLPLTMALAIAAAAQPASITWRPVAAGVEHAHVVRAAPGGGNWNINVLRVDMRQARLDVVHAKDAAVGLETVTTIAQRTGAIAAINGGYFRTSGEFVGDSTGTLQIDGSVWSEPDRGRASVGLIRDGQTSRLLFGHVVWQATIHAGGRKWTVNGLNRARGPNEMIVFTPEFGPNTVTDASGLEVVVRSGRVVEVRDNAGASAIPDDGFVVSVRGDSAEWARRHLRPGVPTRFLALLRPADRSRENPWATAEDILGAGPKLVTAGGVDVTDVREKMLSTFAGDLHPRTAIGALPDGRALLLVADGRHPPERVGISLHDLARVLIGMGAREAINLDGGGSTAMVVQGKLVNVPSDVTGERPVSDAIIVRPITPR